MKNVLITGGCGFIGSNFVKYLISLKCYFPIILDKLTYAGSKENINQISEENFELVEGDICNEQLLLNLFKKYKFIKYKDTITFFEQWSWIRKKCRA